MAIPAKAELIVLAAPLSSDRYYADVADRIFEFHIAFAKQAEGRDEILILTDERSFRRYADALGEGKVARVPMQDIWMRDFTLSGPADSVLFRYTAEGQGSGASGQTAADAVQGQWADLAGAADLEYRETDLLNDGGNFVDDDAGNLVLSRKFLRDNDLGEDDARDLLRRLTGAQNIAFIEADEQGGLEHADGVVSFVDTNTLVINTYPEDPAYGRQLKADLRAGLPGVKIHEIVTPYDGSAIYDERFGSACGLYTNALVTPRRGIGIMKARDGIAGAAMGR